jgi:hypothetical protein
MLFCKYMIYIGFFKSMFNITGIGQYSLRCQQFIDSMQ